MFGGSLETVTIYIIATGFFIAFKVKDSTFLFGFHPIFWHNTWLPPNLNAPSSSDGTKSKEMASSPKLQYFLFDSPPLKVDGSLKKIEKSFGYHIVNLSIRLYWKMRQNQAGKKRVRLIFITMPPLLEDFGESKMAVFGKNPNLRYLPISSPPLFLSGKMLRWSVCVCEGEGGGVELASYHLEKVANARKGNCIAKGSERKVHPFRRNGQPGKDQTRFEKIWDSKKLS